MNDVISKPEHWEVFNSSILIEVTRDNGVFTCSGVAISPSEILTAAHCLEGKIKKVKIYTSIKYDPSAPYFEIAHFEIHPDYNPSKSDYLNDIAKIRLAKELPNTIRIHPVYLTDDIHGDFVRFGFGEREDENARTIITPTFKFINKYEKVIELNDHYSKSGDSGGPIFLVKNNLIYLVAIHSTLSKGPQGEFSYNPLVNKYLDWINQGNGKNTHLPLNP